MIRNTRSGWLWRMRAGCRLASEAPSALETELAYPNGAVGDNEKWSEKLWDTIEAVRDALPPQKVSPAFMARDYSDGL